MTGKSDKKPIGPGKGQKTREKIVALALHMAAQEGLGVLSIGILAKELKMSKSGLFVHFRSRENLESAVVERASLLFLDHVVVPIEEAGLEGIERVWALCDNWLSFVEKGVLPGGYFFSGAFSQCAGQKGPISMEITKIMREWINTLKEAVGGARNRGEFRWTVGAKRTAFELNSILVGEQWSYLMGYKNRGRVRSAILAKLGNVATDKIPAEAFDSVWAWRNYLAGKQT